MRVLIATVTAGGGHLAAAAALDEAWRRLRPEDAIERLDLVKFFSPIHRKIVSDGYVSLVKHAPELWGMMFSKTDNPKLAGKLNRLKRVFPSNSRARFKRFVKQFKPDAVLCTHYLPLESLAELRKERDGLRPMAVSVVTDFEAHALWMDPCVDLYCVAAEETKARLVARGADPGNVVATGIPVSGKFSAPTESKAVRKVLGLRDDLPVVLVPSGGFGMGPVGAILAELDKVSQPFQIVVVTGRNEELRRELAAHRQQFRHKADHAAFQQEIEKKHIDD
jgi:processive 1,2-diacylglycerol beta-glucosyltransferase